MNLIYMCIFYQENYIHLLKLLVESIFLKSNINKENTDILIITSALFEPLIKKELESFNLLLNYHILNLNTLMESSCAKLMIFQYDKIDKYDKILYLDADVLINSDINVLFDIDICSEKIYALEEGTMNYEHWGAQFIDPEKYNKNMPAFSAGVLYFMNSPSIKKLFQDTLYHIADYMSNNTDAPASLDQPFLIYNSLIQNKYNTKMMKLYVENNPSHVNSMIIIYHFPGGPGIYLNKYNKMLSFFDKIKNTFDTRNDMIKYYSNKIVNPRVLEIGVFKGDFLDFIVKNCTIGFIDAVDLFEGETCSGDADGNNVIFYDIGKSYIELSNKYKNNKNVRIHKCNSISFLQSQDDNTYDIIYIDGDHSYEGVKKDLIDAYRKIKDGGYIMGHDYEMNMDKANNIYDFGVKKAVDEFCEIFNQTILAKAFDGCVSYCIHINKN